MDLLAGLTPDQLALALATALAAAFIRGLAGFGMALVLVPVLGLAITPQAAVVSMNLIGVLIGLVGIRGLVRQAEHSAVPIGALAIVATPAGLYLLSLTGPDLARLLIAMIALAAFAALLLPRKSTAAHYGAAVTGATGIMSGILTGFAGMPGPPVIPYYLRRPVPPHVARASMMAIFLATSIAGSLAAWWLGMLGGREIMLTALLFPAILLGNWLGSQAFGKISDLAWRLFVGAVLGVSAVIAVARLLES